MAAIATYIFTGDSGTMYKFNVYPKDTNFKALGAVYFITQRYEKTPGNFHHHPIYVGQSGDISKRFDNHHRVNCFERHNWNCICIHQDSSEISRIQKERDLIERYDPDCNQE